VERIWDWGIEVIVAVQAYHNPAMDILFNAFSFLGSEEFYAVLLPLFYWCLDKSLGQRFAYLLLLSGYANAALKELFGHPRPYEYDPRVFRLDHTSPENLGYGLPSGHTQSALTVYGYIAYWFRRRWLTWTCVALVISIGFSRIYLGAHFPSDVLGGLVAGGVCLGLFVWLEPGVTGWLAARPAAAQLGLAVVGPIVLLLPHYSSNNALSAAGVLIGLGIGIVVESRTLRFRSDGPFKRRAVRFLVGIAGVLVLRGGLRLVFPGEATAFYTLFRVLRYGLVGLWVTLVGPWVFHRLGLVSVDRAEP